MIERTMCPNCQNTAISIDPDENIILEIEKDYSTIIPQIKIDEFTFKSIHTAFMNPIENVIRKINYDWVEGKLSQDDVVRIACGSFSIRPEIHLICNICKNKFREPIDIYLYYPFYKFHWDLLKEETNKALKDFHIEVEDIEKLSGQYKVEIDIVNALYEYDSIKYSQLKNLKELTIRMPEEKGGGAEIIIGPLLLSITGAFIYDIVKIGVKKFLNNRKKLTFKFRLKKMIRKKLANEDFDSILRFLSENELKDLLGMKKMPGLNKARKTALMKKAIEKKALEYSKELLEIINDRNI